LASEGITLNNEAYALFVDAVQDNFYLAVSLLKSRAEGDYSRDETPDSFPEFTERPTRGEGVSCWELFEGYVTATRRAPKTVSRWRAVFLQMQKDFADTSAEGITEDMARSWIAGLVKADTCAAADHPRGAEGGRMHTERNRRGTHWRQRRRLKQSLSSF